MTYVDVGRAAPSCELRITARADGVSCGLGIICGRVWLDLTLLGQEKGRLHARNLSKHQARSRRIAKRARNLAGRTTTRE